MGIVASLASAPVAVEIYKDELRHEQRKIQDQKFGHFQVGDTDLARIKRLTFSEAESDGEVTEGQGNARPGTSKRVEKIYLTGIYKKKFEYMQDRHEKELPVKTVNPPPSGRKIRSAYPNVRFTNGHHPLLAENSGQKNPYVR